MKTRLSLFCRELDAVIRPILVPVENVVGRLGDGAQPLPVHEGLPALRDAHHKVRQLIEKVSRQQAYVLIFGPLKSGKSTLMNAVTGAYVSEVTALPAYPCLVYVSHAKTADFSITYYDGSTETIRHPEELRARIEKAHEDLATQIRNTEDFDPAIHFPGAIRKIDVTMPAGNMEESGAVLVDTPGLYSRMKFGYDQMTRDFRDTAACAVFVVKTDNLFLEQVFEEFHELLTLFGRIFLVVNLDGTKQDLRPDGSLEPSLESQNPQRVIEAFENLSMSAPIKAAAESGRLKIYPIDLLQAASYRLRERSGRLQDGDEPTIVQTGFEALRRDMTDYLNSSEYSRAFVNDSLRYAGGLFDQLREQAGSDEVRTITLQTQELENELRCAEMLSAVLARLGTRDWRQTLQALEESFTSEASRVNMEIVRGTVAGISDFVGDWFANSHSLASLIGDDFQSHMDQIQRQFSGSALQILERLVEGDAAGLDLSDETLADLAAADLDLRKLRQQSIGALNTTGMGTSLSLPISYEDIPVRKAVWDWVLFRGQAKLRAKLFGPSDAPNETIQSEIKEKQLSQPGREFLLDSARQYLHCALPERFKQITGAIFANYTSPIIEAIQQRIRSLRVELDEQLARVHGRLDSLGGISHAFECLEEACAKAEQGLTQLGHSYRPQNPSEEEETAPVRAEGSDAVKLG